MRALTKSLAVVAVFLVLIGLFVPLEKAVADGGAITGIVTRAVNGDPLVGITVELYDDVSTRCSPPPPTSLVSTNSTGWGQASFTSISSPAALITTNGITARRGSADPVTVVDGVTPPG